jgi:hypothetical protein
MNEYANGPRKRCVAGISPKSTNYYYDSESICICTKYELPQVSNKLFERAFAERKANVTGVIGSIVPEQTANEKVNLFGLVFTDWKADKVAELNGKRLTGWKWSNVNECTVNMFVKGWVGTVIRLGGYKNIMNSGEKGESGARIVRQWLEPEIQFLCARMLVRRMRIFDRGDSWDAQNSE